MRRFVWGAVTLVLIVGSWGCPTTGVTTKAANGTTSGSGGSAATGTTVSASSSASSSGAGACGVGKMPYRLTATAQEGASRLALDSMSVYWVNDNPDGGVMKVNKCGGVPVALATNLSSPSSIAVKLANVYWTDYGDGTVSSVLSSEAMGAHNPPFASGQLQAIGIALDASHVYWANHAIEGGIFYESLPVTPDDFNSLGGVIDSPEFLATDGQNVYYTTSPSSGLNVIAKVGVPGSATTEVTMLATSPQVPTGIAVDTTYVYWSTKSDADAGTQAVGMQDAGTQNGQVLRIPITGVGLPTTLAEGEDARGAALDADYFYWVNPSNGTVMKVPLEGGDGGIVVASDQPAPVWVAVDDSGIYWVNGDGKLWGMAK